MIDISRNTTDIHYRYKMPRVVVQHIGKSTGTKTLIVNLKEVSSSLKRVPLHLLKFISYELATQTKVDDKKYIVNGKHETKRIQDCVFDFIDLFVICNKCDNPETFYIDKGGLMKECLACGETTGVVNHKLNATILRDIDKQNYNNMYEQFSKEELNLSNVLQQEDITSESVFDVLKNMGVNENDMIATVLSLGEEKVYLCEGIMKNVDRKVLFGSIDGFFETHNDFTLLDSVFNLLKECGIKKNEMFKYFSRPQNNKKRSLEYKSAINKYFSS